MSACKRPSNNKVVISTHLHMKTREPETCSLALSARHCNLRHSLACFFSILPTSTSATAANCFHVEEPGRLATAVVQSSHLVQHHTPSSVKPNLSSKLHQPLHMAKHQTCCRVPKDAIRSHPRRSACCGQNIRVFRWAPRLFPRHDQQLLGRQRIFLLLSIFDRLQTGGPQQIPVEC